jgi:hypothetical protein
MTAGDSPVEAMLDGVLDAALTGLLDLLDDLHGQTETMNPRSGCLSRCEMRRPWRSTSASPRRRPS